MSRLRIFSESDPSHVEMASSNHAEIARELAKINVRFEQWEASQPVAPGASSEDVLAAYRADIDRLVAENGFQSVDVVSIAPDHPQREVMTKETDLTRLFKDTISPETTAPSSK